MEWHCIHNNAFLLSNLKYSSPSKKKKSPQIFMCAIQNMIKEKDITRNQACYHLSLNTIVQRDIMQVQCAHKVQADDHGEGEEGVGDSDFAVVGGG